jgi:hypothetical protein
MTLQNKKKPAIAESTDSRRARALSDRDLEPRDLMQKLTDELAQKVRQSFSDRERFSN